jgi:hypothetical protein
VVVERADTWGGARGVVEPGAPPCQVSAMPILAMLARRGLVLVLVAGCKPGSVTKDHELCAKAAARYEACEDLGQLTPRERELTIDRWRGLCRASFTGETRQLLPGSLAIYEQMNDDARRALREVTTCMSKAETCDAYAACE